MEVGLLEIRPRNNTTGTDSSAETRASTIVPVAAPLVDEDVHPLNEDETVEQYRKSRVGKFNIEQLQNTPLHHSVASDLNYSVRSQNAQLVKLRMETEIQSQKKNVGCCVVC